MPELSFWVPGIAQPQGSIKYKGRTRAGKPILTSDNKGLKYWRQMITLLALTKVDRLNGPIAVEVNFVFSRPKGHFGAKGGVLPSAPVEHLVKPDIDKLCRAVLDALTDAAIFRDDSQVVRIVASKAYTTTAPGAVITVRDLVPAMAQPAATPGDPTHAAASAGIR